jgi:G3E family GTPase
VSSADLLVLNKLDLVPSGAHDALEAALREFEPEAPILRAEHADIDLRLLFPPDPQGLREQRRARAEPAPAHSHESFAAEELVVEAGVGAAALLERLAALGALRVKGFVETAEGVRAVQGVGPRIELDEPSDPPARELLGRLVVIRRA